MTEATETAQYSVLCGRKALHYPDVSARALRAGRVMMIMIKNRQFWGCFASTVGIECKLSLRKRGNAENPRAIKRGQKKAG